VIHEPVHYVSDLEDSARWDGFPTRPGDIVISTRSKTGTTWVQMICALLIFQRRELPQPLTTLSPWLDMKLRPVEVVHAQLDAQTHRRFIKTHTPLDGLRLSHDVTYLVTGRDPRDAAISLHHQSANLDRPRMRHLLGLPEPAGGGEQPGHDDDRTFLLRWIANDDSPTTNMDGLRGMLWHAELAWQRRGESNIVLVHYADLLADLEAQMRRLAALLRIDVPESSWPELVAAARFDQMRERADELVPDDRAGIMRDNTAFFRQGRSGQWRDVLTEQEAADYDRRVASVAPRQVIDWLHR
jgi:aryl sulfotransferase